MAYTVYADILSADILSGILSGILSDICSDILSGSLSGIYSDILSGILTFYLACIRKFFLAFYLTSVLTFYLAVFLASILTFYLVFWHSIWHVFGNSFWHSIWHLFWHSIWQSFWHLFCHSATHCMRNSPYRVRIQALPIASGAGRGVDEGKEKEGVAPLELATLTRHMGKIWDKSDHHTDKHIFRVRGSTTNHHPNPGRKDTTPFKIYTTMAKRPQQRAVSSFVNEIPPRNPGLSIGSILILFHLGDKHRISH